MLFPHTIFSFATSLDLKLDLFDKNWKIKFSLDLEIDIVNHPILQVLVEIHHTKFVQNVKFTSSVEVQDTVEGAGVTVEIILVFLQREGVAQIEDLQIKKYMMVERQIFSLSMQ